MAELLAGVRFERDGVAAAAVRRPEPRAAASGSGGLGEPRLRRCPTPRRPNRSGGTNGTRWPTCTGTPRADGSPARARKTMWSPAERGEGDLEAGLAGEVAGGIAGDVDDGMGARARPSRARRPPGRALNVRSRGSRTEIAGVGQRRPSSACAEAGIDPHARGDIGQRERSRCGWAARKLRTATARLADSAGRGI